MASTALRFDSAKHRYYLMHDGRDEQLPSVTTLLRVLDKPALLNWYARTAAAYAADNWEKLSTYEPSERARLISGAPSRRKKVAGLKGTAVHAWAEALLAGQPVEIPDEHAQQVGQYAEWWQRSGFRAVLTEAMCWAEPNDLLGAPGYAGTFDCLAEHPKYGLTLLDWKTAATGPWPEWALQLAGYAGATYLVRGDADVPMPKIDTLGAVRITPDGTELHVLDDAQRRIAGERFDAVRALCAIDEPAFVEAYVA